MVQGRLPAPALPDNINPPAPSIHGENMKTLVVTYLPRSERSKTKRLVDAFVSESKSHGAQVEMLDLIKDTPDMFLGDNLMAYVLRAYAGHKLDANQAKLMEKMDRMTQQFKSADAVVVAFPLYNFSMPAVMKAYFDSVMQKSQTWDMDANGYVNLMKGKRALVLMTSGGKYEGQMSGWEHGMSLAKTCLSFMGYEAIGIFAGGVDENKMERDEILAKAIAETRAVAKAWAGK